MESTIITGPDGTPWTSLDPGEEYTLGRGIEVDRILSESRYVSAHACTVLATSQTCWIENWSTHSTIIVRSSESARSMLEIAPRSRVLNPFSRAQVQIPSAVSEHVCFQLEVEFLEGARLLPHAGAGETVSLPDAMRSRIRSERIGGNRPYSVRQWYACLALCEPFLVSPQPVRTPTMAEIASRIAPLVDVETNVSVEEVLGRRASAKTVAKRLRNVRRLLARLDSPDGQEFDDYTGLGEADAARLLAETLVGSGAVTGSDVDFYLRDPSSNQPEDPDDDLTDATDHEP